MFTRMSQRFGPPQLRQDSTATSLTGVPLTPADQSVQLFGELLHGYHPRDFAVQFWNGATLPPDAGAAPRFTLHIRSPLALRELFWRPDEVTLGRAYIDDELDIEGDIAAVAPLADYLLNLRIPWKTRLRIARLLLALPPAASNGRPAHRIRGRLHSLRRDRAAVTSHYDVSNDFYRLWLDRRMVYSCGYFTSPADSLDDAQAQKLDLVCRKLRLQPGQTLLDIGCGWGGLLIHAAANYGIRATGITLSAPQAQLARERITLAGLSDRCHVAVTDYREFRPAEPLDAIASIGMVEHVGAVRLSEYFGRAHDLLRPGGAFLCHGIGTLSEPAPGPSFIRTFVFPDTELPRISRVLHAAEQSGFEVRDVESLREHYALTLKHWVARLESAHAAALQHISERTYRIWRLYMSLSAVNFNAGHLSVYQSLLARPDGGRLDWPLTRVDWYRS